MADASRTDPAKVQSLLAALSISSQTHEHEAVLTCEAHKAALPSDEILLTKNLLLKVKKKKTRWLFVTKADKKVDLKKLAKILGIPSNVRFVDKAAMTELLGIGEGALSAFAAINDAEGIVQVVLDKDLNEAKLLGVHPLVNTATVAITPADLVTFLKAQGKEPIEVDLAAAPAAAEPKQKGPKKKVQKKTRNKSAKGASKHGKGGGMEYKKSANFAGWYKEVVTKGEMIDYYDISGCYILRPDSYFIWEQVQDFINTEIKKLGVRNCYFPMFVSKSALCKEEKHIEGFAAEVAWVTKSGKSDLQEHIAIRPTSETVMYPTFGKWIRSHRDLPLRLNQWCNVVRWEFKNPTPFIRTREFLWQEGHTAHAGPEEAREEVMAILDIYARVYEELLCVPVIKGNKTEGERFPGGDYTTTIEALIPQNGRAVQAATSHGLGQHFGKMFDISYEDKDGSKQIPHQNSWGLTTRSLGVMIMNHSDDRGLVLPPRVASIQAVIVPITYKQGASKQEQIERAHRIAAELKAAGVRVHVDDRDNYGPGWKYAHWELRGVPLRIELGPKDMAAEQVSVVRRDRNKGDADARENCKWDAVSTRIVELLDIVQKDLLAKARQIRDPRVKTIGADWDAFMTELNRKNLVLAPSCNELECEEMIKTLSGEESQEVETAEPNPSADPTGESFEILTGKAKSLCIPFAGQYQPAVPAGTKCFCKGCDKPATVNILYGRSY